MPKRVALQGVQQVGIQFVAGLERDGLLPALPEDLRASQLERTVTREATPFDMLGVAWYASGNLLKPTGIMALRQVYDYAYMADVIEIFHIAGTKRAIFSLIETGKRVATERGMPLTGETEIANRSFIHAMQSEEIGFSIDRLRLRWEP